MQSKRTYGGFELVENPSLVVTKHTKTKRSIWKRLFQGDFSRKFDETVEENVPDTRLIFLADEEKIMGHPDTIRALLQNEKSPH